MNIISFFMNAISWVAIAILAWRFLREPGEKAVMWKIPVVILVGIFSFSIPIPMMGDRFNLAILPLGVWILFAIFSRKNGGSSWRKYRKFAWLGFLANYIFLAASVMGGFLHHAIYPENQPETYLSTIAEAEILQTHPSAREASLDIQALKSELGGMEEAEFFSDQWYEDTYASDDPAIKNKERFPYMMTGFRASMGSGIISQIFVEQDGKGLLITTQKEQLYFRAEHPFLKGAE